MVRGCALGAAMIAGADQTFRDVVREAIGRRDAFIRWRTNAGSVEQAIAELSRTLGVELQETLESVEVEFLERLADRAHGMAGDRRGAGAGQ